MIDLIYPPKPVLVQTTVEAKLEKETGEQESSGKQFSGDELVRLLTHSDVLHISSFLSTLLGEILLR
jgi:hypothetical protein